ncbi:MAG: hypothetical protein M3167_10470 [Acidobacteriota bacterium]|nr:hypothetical protein [Acidobacteriota bacterium]
MPRLPAWIRRPADWAELFAIGNFAFLAVDIGLAHSVNSFARAAEWIPLVFSLAAAVLLAIGFSPAMRARTRGLGLAVGALSVLVGISGLLWHLDSHFFREQTLKNLVYTAPFAAPLAYTGLGLLVLLGRLVDSETEEWAVWVLVLALGGFIGNFALSVADHAQNAFFHPTEWIAAAGAAFGIGFLFAAAFLDRSERFLRLCLFVLAGEAAVGVLGFALHLRGNLSARGGSTAQRFLYGAPIFAPLLFTNIALLAAIGVFLLIERGSRRKRR